MKFRIDRREFVFLAGASLAAPQTLLAQSAHRVYRIAILDDDAENARAAYMKHFRNRLRVLGLVEGKQVVYEARYARGALDRLPALAAELIALQPDVIVALGTPTAIAAKKATSNIPIVVPGSGNPVGTGLVASLARPGGNVTGTSILSTVIASKQLELLQEVSGGGTRFAYLSDLSNQAVQLIVRGVQEHARTRKLSILVFDGRERAELESSLEAIRRAGVQGLLFGTSLVLLKHRDRILQFAAQEKLPVVYGRREYVEAGGLISYTADQQWAFQRAADYVHRILNGAKPADLPFEQSSKVLMVLNLKTARALGIKIPESVRVRADEIID